MLTVFYFFLGIALGYAIASYLESVLHEYVSDATVSAVRKWRRHPRLFRILLNTYFTHHVIHHFQTFRKSHIVQFDTLERRARIDRVLQTRGRHGRIIIGGGYAHRVHAEGGFVFAFPGLLSALALSFVLPVSMAVGAGL